MSPAPTPGADAALAAAIRAEAGAVVAVLSRAVGDFDVAEEAVQEAVLEALRHWREHGVPDRPGAWLTTAARRNALDHLRARQRRDAVVERIAQTQPPVPTGGGLPDERLPLLFACCHPALAPEARLALTLRAVVGLTTAQVARAFLVPEATMAQRIVRAKRKIVATGIPLTVPPPTDRAARLDDVLTATCLMFNEAFVSTGGSGDDRDLAADALWLAGLLATSLPQEPEALGLLALLTAQHARRDARFAADGSLVLLEDQDRSRWDRAAIASADALLQRAASYRRPGRFQLQAAVALCHANAATWQDTDWLQIVLLYDLLLAHDPSPVTRLNRAVAVAKVGGPEMALREVETLAPVLDRYHLFHATREVLLRELGRSEEALAAGERALSLTANPAEQVLLRTRLDGAYPSPPAGEPAQQPPQL